MIVLSTTSVPIVQYVSETPRNRPLEPGRVPSARYRCDASADPPRSNSHRSALDDRERPWPAEVAANAGTLTRFPPSGWAIHCVRGFGRVAMLCLSAVTRYRWYFYHTTCCTIQ